MHFLDKTCKKKVWNWKKELHHRILHIPNILGIKIQDKLTILIFWTKLTQKGYFQSKTSKSGWTLASIIIEKTNLGLDLGDKSWCQTLPQPAILCNIKEN